MCVCVWQVVGVWARVNASACEKSTGIMCDFHTGFWHCDESAVRCAITHKMFLAISIGPVAPPPPLPLFYCSERHFWPTAEIIRRLM